MGRRLVVTLVLDEGLRDDVFEQLANVVRAARGLVGFHVERFTAAGEEQDRFGRPAAQGSVDEAELEAVTA